MRSEAQAPKRLIKRDRKNRSLRVLANAVLIAALLPYFSPIPITGMDAQLTALVVSVLSISVLLIFAPRYFKLTKLDVWVAGVGLLVLFYIDLSRVSLNVLWLRTCGTMLLGFPVYLAVRIFYPYMSPRVFVRIVAIYLVVLLFQITFPYYYLSIFKHFLAEIRWEPGSIRGPNGMCVEPSMLANMCVLFVVSMYFFHREYWREHKKQVAFVFAASAIMLLISQSATGVVLAMMVSFLALLFSKRSVLVKGIAVGAIVVAVIIGGIVASAGSSRGAEFVSSMAKNPAVIVQDPSFALRFVGLFLGLHSLPDVPLGTGELLLDYKLADKAWEGRTMTTLWPDRQLRQYVREYVMERSSGLGPMIQRMGVFSFAVFGVLLWTIRGFREAWVVRVFLLALLLNTTLFASTIWFLVGCCAALVVALSDDGPSKLAEVAAKGAF
jgi:hypothetical protein